MNLRLDHESLRFRLSREELNTLLAGEVVVESVPLPGASRLTVSVMTERTGRESTSGKLMELKSSCGDRLTTFSLLLSPEAIAQLRVKADSKEGVECSATLDDGASILLTLEVDQGRPRKRP